MQLDHSASVAGLTVRDIERRLARRKARLFDQLLEGARDGKRASLEDLVQSVRDYTEAFIVSHSMEDDGGSSQEAEAVEDGLDLVSATDEILSRVDRARRSKGG